MAWTERRKITVSPVGVITQNLHGYVGFLALAKELLQNADDAGVVGAAGREGHFGANTVRFRFFSDRVEVENNGPPFDDDDINAIAEINFGHKQRIMEAAGYFGAGFGAVYAISDAPEIHSNGRRFRMNWVTQTQDEDRSPTSDPQWTKIVLPFRRDRLSILARNFEAVVKAYWFDSAGNLNTRTFVQST